MTVFIRVVGLSALACCSAHSAAATDEVSLPTPGTAPDRPSSAPISAPLSGWKPALYSGPTLGEPCPSSNSPGEVQELPSQAIRPVFPVRVEPVCGTQNRVSLEIVRQSAMGIDPAQPCEPSSLDPSASQGYSRAFCTVGDELVVSTACYMCRMINVGEVAHARLSELTTEQNQMLAQIAGLSSPPRDAEEWRRLSARAQAERREAPAFAVPPPP